MKIIFKNKLFKAQNGQVMVESIIAISVLVIGLLGIFTLLSRSLSLNRVIADQSVATHLAAEGIELVKSRLDRNALLNAGGSAVPWNDGVNRGDYEMDFNDSVLAVNQNRKLNFDSGSGQYSYDFGAPTAFQRLIAISPNPDGNEIKVNSIVAWTTRGGGQFEVNLEDHFFNWR